MPRFRLVPWFAVAASYAIQAGPPDYDAYAAEVERALTRDHAERWFPACVDLARGGFHQNFDRRWTKRPNDDRFVVFQSRMTWFTARMALAGYEEYKPWMEHGVEALTEGVLDPEHGGYFWLVGLDGHPIWDQKHLYGQVFALYGLAAAARAGDARALQAAKDQFEWMERHMHDADHGGYAERVAREGGPVRAGVMDMLGTPVGFRSQNSHLHLVEALTELVLAWPDPRAKARLQEGVDILVDRMFSPPGALHTFFTDDWRPVPGTHSYGHDVEAAFLIVEAARALGRPYDPKVWDAAKALVDHALDVGFDRERGGFYASGEGAFGAVDKSKVWWTQAEALNAVLTMHERYGHETDAYWIAFERTWRWIRDVHMDREFGGMYESMSETGELYGDGTKGHMWKAAYHDGRAFLNVLAILRRLSESKSAPVSNSAS